MLQIVLVFGKLSTRRGAIWKEKSVEDLVTLGPTAQATLVYFNRGWRATITF
jgi:hypothetical protein